jgi:hypothetical protein
MTILKTLAAGVATVACALAVTSCSPTLNRTKIDPQSLPTIKADRAHQINVDPRKYVNYEVPAGKGLMLDTAAPEMKYALAPPFVGHSKVVRLDPVAPTHANPVSVHFMPGRDLYQVCPDSGLQSGEKFAVQIGEEGTDRGHYNFDPRWCAYVIVK